MPAGFRALGHRTAIAPLGDREPGAHAEPRLVVFKAD
jgi:hypothetical protein